MQNKQQIDLIKLPKFKIQNFPPDSNLTKQTNLRRIFRKYFRKENNFQKFPACTSSYQETDICSLVCGKSWHISNRSGRISLEKPGISRISTSYLKAYPASARIQNLISTCFRQPPPSLPIWIPVSAHDKLLLNDSLTGGGNLRETCDMGIRACYKYKTTQFWQFSKFGIPTSLSFMPCSASSTEFICHWITQISLSVITNIFTRV